MILVLFVLRKDCNFSQYRPVDPHNCPVYTVGSTASVVWWLACWPLVPEFRCEEILSMPSFGGEVK
jgi:hypothetical protein